MTIQQLRQQVEQIKQIVFEPETFTYVGFHFGKKDEPHGCLGGHYILIETGEAFAIPYLDEKPFYSRALYESQINRNKGLLNQEGYRTFNEWFDNKFCKCGKHGRDGKQSYGIEIKNEEVLQKPITH